MIIYNPLGGLPFPTSFESLPKRCFLMTRLGDAIPPMVEEMRAAIEACYSEIQYEVIDAQAEVTGRDFLLIIWRLIASTPLSVGIVQQEIPQTSQANIFYELGIAQALGKETIIVKCPNSDIPSDFVRTEYIEFNDNFSQSFRSYLEGMLRQADFYETLSDQLENDPIKAVDYLKRAFIITADDRLREKAGEIVQGAGIEERAASSVERLAANF